MGDEIDTIGTFTGPEIERALNWTRRDFELLKREGLVPGQLTEAARGRLARFHFNTLGRLAMTAALAQHSDGYLVPARIVAALAAELELIYGRFPFGLPDLDRKLLARGDHEGVRTADGEPCPYRILRQAWRGGDIDRDTTFPGDYLLVIADGEFVGSSNLHGMPSLVPFLSEAVKIVPELRFTYAGRAGGVKIERLDSPEGMAYGHKRITAAASILTVNFSLAIRRAALAIVEMREGGA